MLERRMAETTARNVLKTVRDDKNSSLLVKNNTVTTYSTDKKFPS